MRRKLNLFIVALVVTLIEQMEQLEVNNALIIFWKEDKLKEKHLNKGLDRTEIAYRPRKILYNIYDIFKDLNLPNGNREV